MRESNFKNIALNKAAVSITTNLYDRRALDSTMDQPLVNSLNHLTFLTSSSAKVRETLTNDGGLERLVSILHECHKSHTTIDKKRPVENEKTNALIAWKWTLAFQCLVLVATRGTELIRKRVVEAGVLQIISTVLDNYLLFVRNFDNKIDDHLNEKFLNVVVDKLHRIKSDETKSSQLPILEPNDSKDYDYFNICKYVTSDCNFFKYFNGYLCPSSTKNQTSSDDPLEVTEWLAKENMHSINETITCPRTFLDGKLIPKDDDVVWSLQLLAFTSKYSNLKSFFQDTHLVEALSLRTILDECNRFDENSNNSSLKGNGMNSDSMSDTDIDDYDMMYTDSHRFNHKSPASPLQSSQIQLTQSSLTSSFSSSQQPYIQPSTQQFMQSPTTSSSQASGLSPLMQTLSHQFSSQQKGENSGSSLSTLRDEINDENMDPNLTNQLTKSQSSSTSTNSSLYGNSILDNESINASTLPSTICDNQQDLDLEKSSSITLPSSTKVSIFKDSNTNLNINDSLVDSIVKLDTCLTGSLQNNKQTLSSLVEVCEKLNIYYERSLTSHKIRSINESKLATRNHLNKYNYETYFTSKNIESSESTESKYYELKNLFQNKVNLFRLVEKFTMKTINTADMCYWAGIVMRNSCRKDEQRGGVRQCAYHGCGKWEQFPRQFAKCRRCKRTKYCSKECQLKAWGYHKHWCLDSATASSSSTTTGTTTTTTAVPNTAIEGAPTPENNNLVDPSNILNESAIADNQNEQFINRIVDEESISENL